MMSYAAPIRDMLFVLDKLADIAKIATLPGFEDPRPRNGTNGTRRGREVQRRSRGTAKL
jgi:hypothetical protein